LNVTEERDSTQTMVIRRITQSVAQNENQKEDNKQVYFTLQLTNKRAGSLCHRYICWPQSLPGAAIFPASQTHAKIFS